MSLKTGAAFKVVTFVLGEEKFCIEILLVQEIVREVKVTRVPKAPAFVEGVINLRGKVIPVVDLRKRFEIPVGEKTKDSRVIILNINDSLVGFIVDSVDRVIDIKKEHVEETPGIAFTVESKFIAGVAKVGEELILLMDIDRIFSSEEKAFLEKV
ncbi:MAG: purine-binding chemotaxis protein CheW [Oligoflexia bacterium]|nr:purine-binding chemotaxis protein CheW [Oligoflexia bacterium]